jgi:hypothetical protein
MLRLSNCVRVRVNRYRACRAMQRHAFHPFASQVSMLACFLELPVQQAAEREARSCVF